MPYFITDKSPDCPSWAVVKEDGELVACHDNKESAIDQAVAISLAENTDFLGERAVAGYPAIILDVDKTIIISGGLNQRLIDYLETFDDTKFIVITARTESKREQTIKDLEGFEYDQLLMKPNAEINSTDYKRETAAKLLEKYNLMIAIDDNNDILTAYRSLGITAIHPSEIPNQPQKENRAIDIEAPAYMRAAARRGLEYYSEGLAGDGLTERTVREARLLAEGQVSDDKWIRLAAWIARHLVDFDAPKNSDPDDPEYPGPGLVAALLWGAGPSKRNAERALDFANGVVARIRDEEESRKMQNKPKETRAEPGELAIGDLVTWQSVDEVYYGRVEYIMSDGLLGAPESAYAIEGTPDDPAALIRLWELEDGVWTENEEFVGALFSALTKIDALPEVETPELMVEDDEARAKWLRTAWAIKAKLEGGSDEARALGKTEVRTNNVNFEIRADENDGMQFTGYASVFNSASEDLGGFREYVAPGAFSKSLKSRAEIKLLWNHDTSEPLASLRGGSLRLTEDSKGLLVTAKLPNTTRGRDVAELIRTKVIDSMSFGFNVLKDSWSKDGQTRTLESVKLFEVSVVTWPAYTATTAEVRSAPGINADDLADALLRLESGETLEANHANLITDVVNKLRKEPEVEQVESEGGTLLDLKKKKLDLLMQRI